MILEQLVPVDLSIYRKKSWQFKIYTLANHMKILLNYPNTTLNDNTDTYLTL